jgi:hypothetical protein
MEPAQKRQRGAGLGAATASSTLASFSSSSSSSSSSTTRSQGQQQPSLSSIDLRIAELEAELDGPSSSSSYSSSDYSGDEESSEESGDESSAVESSNMLGKRFAPASHFVAAANAPLPAAAPSSADRVILSNECNRAADRIAPLPAHLLPGPSKSAAGGKKKKRKRSADHNAVPMGDRDPTSTTARNHTKRDKHFWRAAREEAMKAYEPHHNKSLFCRLCKQDFANAELLVQHRATPEHARAARMEKKLTFCNLCKKQFTSVHQLADHVKGKWHKQRSDKMFSKGNRGRVGGRGGGRGGGGGRRGRGGRGRFRG